MGSSRPVCFLREPAAMVGRRRWGGGEGGRSQWEGTAPRALLCEPAARGGGRGGRVREVAATQQPQQPLWKQRTAAAHSCQARPAPEMPPMLPHLRCGAAAWAGRTTGSAPQCAARRVPLQAGGRTGRRVRGRIQRRQQLPCSAKGDAGTTVAACGPSMHARTIQRCGLLAPQLVGLPQRGNLPGCGGKGRGRAVEWTLRADRAAVPNDNNRTVLPPSHRISSSTV